MRFWERKLLFDQADWVLMRQVESALSGSSSQILVDTSLKLHPHGIRKLTEPRALRLTRAMLNLLDTFDAGSAALERRLNALQSLHDELAAGFDVPFPCNTARVVLQLIKDLVRERGEKLPRLRLAHDLRIALAGNPLFIRKLLHRYHLVELPEAWEAVCFDQHVHDANTKGRKSPSHLVMDAWIKGIRKLQVIYYNEVPRNAARELLQAAEIVGISVRIGVEFQVLHRGRFVEMIWAPRGFTGSDDYLKFLDRIKAEGFIRKAREAADYRNCRVLETLKRFNQKGRLKLAGKLGIDLPELSEEEFLSSIPYGLPSLDHLGEFIARRCRKAGEKQHLAIDDGKLSPEQITGTWLDRSYCEEPPRQTRELPALMQLAPAELIEELHRFSPGFRMTLNLSGMKLADVLEILYDCRGGITALEIFNLKDHLTGAKRDDRRINALRHALNEDQVLPLKNLISEALGDLKKSDLPDREERIAKLLAIRSDLAGFLSFYRSSRLGASLGSDSSGRASRYSHGMGLIAIDSLSSRVRRACRRGKTPDLVMLPVRTTVWKQINEKKKRSVLFNCDDPAAEVECAGGNLAALGGGMPLEPEKELLRPARTLEEYWHFCDSRLKGWLKVTVGFAAAFLTFALSGSHSGFIVWFGAPVFLGITAVRNVIQLVAAGGGLRSSPLLRWHDYVSWQRVADSLFYSGLSVPLLEYVIRIVLLQQLLGWNSENHPILVFSVIALANGFYISGHNLLRAFPRQAILGNWLRAPLSIPLAVLYHAAAEQLFSLLHLPGGELILQQGAVIVSKLASDTIGGIIEARADRTKYISARLDDLERKLRELYRLYARLELRRPELTMDKLKNRQQLVRAAGGKNDPLLAELCTNTLDMMYFWMRQPRTMTALKLLLRRATAEERQRLLQAQSVLNGEKNVGKLFLKGLVGENFSAPLAFYMRYHKEYLREFRAFIDRNDPAAANHRRHHK